MQARLEAPKKGGAKIVQPILKKIKPTRPPSKNQNSSVLGHFKMEIQNFIQNFRKKVVKSTIFELEQSFKHIFGVAENF